MTLGQAAGTEERSVPPLTASLTSTHGDGSVAEARKVAETRHNVTDVRKSTSNACAQAFFAWQG